MFKKMFASVFRPRVYEAQPIAVEPYMVRARPARYAVLRLNIWAEDSWAVIEMPAGSIAQASSGKLLMQMSRKEAEDVAHRMTANLKFQIITAEPPNPAD